LAGEIECCPPYERSVNVYSLDDCYWRGYWCTCEGSDARP
jgi:hypothetical protein